MKKTVLISTSSFGVESKEPLVQLNKEGWEVHMNPHGRKLAPSETVELLAGKQAVIAGTEVYTQDMLRKLPDLKIISRCGAGVDGIDRDALKTHGVRLFNTPDVHVQAVAELTVAGLLTLARRVSWQHMELMRGAWNKQMGVNIGSKVVGIFGFGKVGKSVASILGAFGCEVKFFDPLVEATSEFYKKVDKPEELFRMSDIISLHMPVNEHTTGMINKSALESMKPEVLLLNTARGELVVESDLVEFLQTHPLAGAYLDVYSKEPYQGPLANLPNVVLTPHVGTFTRETRVKMELEAVSNLINNFERSNE